MVERRRTVDGVGRQLTGVPRPRNKPCQGPARLGPRCNVVGNNRRFATRFARNARNDVCAEIRQGHKHVHTPHAYGYLRHAGWQSIRCESNVAAWPVQRRKEGRSNLTPPVPGSAPHGTNLSIVHGRASRYSLRRVQEAGHLGRHPSRTDVADPVVICEIRVARHLQHAG